MQSFKKVLLFINWNWDIVFKEYITILIIIINF